MSAAPAPALSRTCPIARPVPPPRATLLLHVALVALWAMACGPIEDPRFASPAQTWQTYARALAAGDVEASWACFSSSYREREYGGDIRLWRAEVEGMTGNAKRAEKRCEIVEERVISQRLAYLLFDGGTLGPGRSSPFVYMLRDEGEWKMTSHLDMVFHRELERAIETGEYRLPERR